jgi:hypothetical protein
VRFEKLVPVTFRVRQIILSALSSAVGTFTAPGAAAAAFASSLAFRLASAAARRSRRDWPAVELAGVDASAALCSVALCACAAEAPPAESIAAIAAVRSMLGIRIDALMGLDRVDWNVKYTPVRRRLACVAAVEGRPLA